MRPLRCAALLAAALATTPAAAAEQTRFEPIRIEIPAEGGTRAVAALLATPDGWHRGDPAVLLLRDPREMLPYGVPAALLGSGLAVLELPADPEGRVASIPWLGAGLALLRGPVEAGRVIAMGSGAAGAAALLAADVEARGTLGAGRLRFAGHVRLGPGAPVFGAGLGSSDEAAWPQQVRSFCQAMAWAYHAQPTPVTRRGGAPLNLDALERGCLGGLDPVIP
jgi:hypothetical protein